MYISIAEIKSRIADSLVEDPREDVSEPLLYLRDVLEGKFALIELAVEENVVNYFIDKGRYPCRCGIGEDPRCGFDGVGHHHESRNAGLGLWPGVFVILCGG